VPRPRVFGGLLAWIAKHGLMMLVFLSIIREAKPSLNCISLSEHARDSRLGFVDLGC
jgi:hypothetical protein